VSAVTSISGSWTLTKIDEADVRLRTGDSAAMNVDVRTPIRSGNLLIEKGEAVLNLVLALDRLKTGNFLTESAARAFISGYRAHDLVYAGSGAAKSRTFGVTGQAQVGTLDLAIGLQVTLLGSDQPSEVELQGSANFGRVHIPLPGMGTVDELMVEIDAKLGLA
jgi:hypothetical protein